MAKTGDTGATAHLIDRLARLQAAQGWDGTLNPTQRAAMLYLARANRFSRTPSAVADYLGTTRGTVSQTLKSLAQKGFLGETKSPTDKRSIRYDLRPAGQEVAAQAQMMDRALATLPPQDRDALDRGLAGLARAVLAQTGGRSFGLCATCRHHRTTPDGAQCALLNVALAPEEADQICQEHSV